MVHSHEGKTLKDFSGGVFANRATLLIKSGTAEQKKSFFFTSARLAPGRKPYDCAVGIIPLEQFCFSF